MSKVNKWLLIGFIVVSALFFVQTNRSCKAYDELSVMKGKYEEQLVVTATVRKESDERIEALEKLKSEMDGMIDSYNTVIANKDEEIAKRDTRLVNLNEQLKNASSDTERVVILTEQVHLLTEKFHLAQEQLGEKDKIIFSLDQKYQTQIKISDELRLQLQSQIELTSSSRQLIDSLESQIVHLRRTSGLKTYLGLGLIALLVVSVAR